MVCNNNAKHKAKYTHFNDDRVSSEYLLNMHQLPTSKWIHQFEANFRGNLLKNYYYFESNIWFIGAEEAISLRIMKYGDSTRTRI